MEITSIDSFLSYYRNVKSRTIRLFDFIPDDKIEWTYKKGKFTIGDIIRHLALIERFLYMENIQQKPGLYTGCGKSFARGLDKTVSLYHDLYDESRAIMLKLSHEDLTKKCVTAGGNYITVWKLLRAMTEHEIHHRGVLYTYLGMLGIETPPVFGLTSEQVISDHKT